MKRHAFFVISSFLLIIGQAAFFSGVRAGYVAPDIMTPFLIWWSMQAPMPVGLIDIVIVATLAETISSLTSGLYLFAWSIGYFSTRYVADHMSEYGFWQSSFIVAFVSMEIIIILQTGSMAIGLVWPWGILQALINAAVTPMLFRLFDALYCHIEVNEMEKP